MTTLPDPYRSAHKAIRVALGRLVEVAGTTDFGEAASFEVLRAELEDVMQLLGTHARIEVQFLDPLLGAHDHEHAKSIQRDHVTLERKLHAVVEGIHDVEEIRASGDDAGARVRGHAFYLQLTRFVGDYLHHLADEEERALPALHRHVDAETLAGAIARAQASVDPGEGARTMGRAIAAMSHPERVALLREAGTEELRRIAQIVLDPVAWRALEQSLR